jgi:hypothetical protein
LVRLRCEPKRYIAATSLHHISATSLLRSYITASSLLCYSTASYNFFVQMDASEQQQPTFQSVNASMVELRQRFETEGMTLDNVKEHLVALTITQLKAALPLCIATSTNSKIVKLRDGEGFKYKVVPNKELSSWLSEGKIVTYNAIDKKTQEPITQRLELPLSKIVHELASESKLAYYAGFEMYSAYPKVLSLYHPPTASIIEGWAERFIAFMESRVANPEALHEELSAHAYRIRHPDAFIVKCFIHYCDTGDTGNSLLGAF